jgi:non-specific serine/threonine protein kinase
MAEQFERAPAADQASQYRRLRAEHANLRAAFEYALGLPGNDGAAIVLATSLFVYWLVSGLLREAEYWLDQVLERCPRRSAARARVLGTRGYLRVLLGDLGRGRDDAVAAVAMAATFSDMAARGRGYSALHRALVCDGNTLEAQDAARSATSCLTSVGDALGLAQLDLVDAMLMLQTGEPDRCCESAARGLDRLPDDELWCTGQLHVLLALGRFLRGDIEHAKPAALSALELHHQLGDVIGTAFGLGTVAFISAGEAQYARTAWFLGASAPLWERAGRWYTGVPAFESLHQVSQRVALAGLGEDEFWRLRAAGAATPAEPAIRRALTEFDPGPDPA